ncbi:MFS transporter [Acidisoma sp.]|uniref:MFS transporter n=1 Tax=Acidisoma sp. TaxID=1872115 RepID=UPI003B00FFBF
MGIAFEFMTVGAKSGSTVVAGIVTLLALVVFIGCFAFSLGPVVWTVINEIFPGHIRGLAVAVATAVNWAAAFLVSQVFLSLINMIGNVPETKGRSLEQIQQLWKVKDA